MEDHHKKAFGSAIICYLVNWEPDEDGGPCTSLTECYIVAKYPDHALAAFSALTHYIGVHAAHPLGFPSTGCSGWMFQADPSEIEAILSLGELPDDSPWLQLLPHRVDRDSFNIRVIRTTEDAVRRSVDGSARDLRRVLWQYLTRNKPQDILEFRDLWPALFDLDKALGHEGELAKNYHDWLRAVKRKEAGK